MEKQMTEFARDQRLAQSLPICSWKIWKEEISYITATNGSALIYIDHVENTHFSVGMMGKFWISLTPR